jgi:catechol 2,3-dioxygenase-like lactoylglutathione lyase family enzyme
MRIVAIDHVQPAMPVGEEEQARAFYNGLLGLIEVTKPAELAKRGGAWVGVGSVKVQLGIESEFVAARKAHPAFLVEGLGRLIQVLKRRGRSVTHDVPLEGYDRVYVTDVFGNRIEFLERLLL